MQDLTLALVQNNIAWHNPEANRKALQKRILNLKEKVDLVVLPEMFTTGFTMEVKENAEPVNGPTLQWMKELASKTSSALTGSIIVEENNKFYNRLYWVTPDQEVKIYDKRHLFRMADEEKHFSGGTENPVLELKGWKVKPLICYDLRFPVWARNINSEYDLLLYVANWPQARIEAWDALLKARAIENLAYTAGVNRVGKDGIGIEYNGQTIVYDFKGEPLNKKTMQDEVIFVHLSKNLLDEYRQKFPAHLDADTFVISK